MKTPIHYQESEDTDSLRDADDKHLAEFLDREDALRIVACVNACQGLSTEALESGALTAARAALKDVIAGFEDLKAEMVRLSDAKDRSASHARAEAVSRAREMSDRARAALAKLEAGK